MLMMFLVGLFVGSFFMNWVWVTFYLGVFSVIFVYMMNFQLESLKLLGSDWGGDIMSVGLSWLSLWICFLMLIASVMVATNSKAFCGLIVLMSILLILVFLSLDLLSFYLFFEGVLIPTLILIVGWGYQPERLQAGIYLVFYTVLASMPLLVVILWFGESWGNSMCFLGSSMNYVLKNYGLMLYLGGVLAFLVKMPMFILHLWLPKAHVEAPVSGSMILAGVLLKMGGYGMMRLSVLFLGWMKFFSWFWIGLSLAGGFILSMVCLRQSDLKALIAYSSVVHMGLVIGGIMSLSLIGFIGSFTMMVGHGLCSSGLFCLANMSYSRVGSRMMLLNKGLMSLFPSGALIWFLLVSSNMAAPPSLNLLGEICLLGSVLFWCEYSLVGLFLVGFFSASYSLYLYTSSQHGSFNKVMMGCKELLGSEYLLVMLHWIPLNLIFLKSDIFLL